MAVIDNVTHWYALPIRLVTLYYGLDTINVGNIDKSSTFEYTPLLAPNRTDTGVTKVIGYKVNANIIIAENQLAHLEDTLQKIESEDPTAIVITFGTVATNSANPSTVLFAVDKAVNGKDSTNVLQQGYNAYVNIGLRDTLDLQLNIIIEGVFSKDAMTTVARQHFEDTDVE